MSKDILTQLCDILEQRKQARPDESYSASLFAAGRDKILKKVGEEATEVVIASKSGENEDIVHEIADLWFHTLVLLKHHNLTAADVYAELESRFGLSGLEEKANRTK